MTLNFWREYAKKNSSLVGYFFMVLLFIAGAASTIICKDLINSGLDTYQILTYSTLMSFALQLCMLDKKKITNFFDMKINIWLLLLQCVLGFVLFGIFYNKALEVMPVNQTVIIYYTNPIFIYIASVYFLGKFLKMKFNPQIILVALISFIGVVMVIKGNSNVEVSFNFLGLIYIFITIITTVAYAIIGKRYTMPIQQYLILSQIIVIILNATIVTLKGGWVALSIKTIFMLFVFGVLSNIGTQVFYIKALDNLSVEKFSTLIFISPVVTALASVIFLGENITIIGMIGMAMVLGSNVLFKPSKNSHEKETEKVKAEELIST